MGRKPYKRRALTTDDVRLLNGEEAEDAVDVVDNPAVVADPHPVQSGSEIDQLADDQRDNEIDRWLAGRKIAARKADGQRVTIITWPDYQRRTFAR